MITSVRGKRSLEGRREADQEEDEEEGERRHEAKVGGDECMSRNEGSRKETTMMQFGGSES